MASPKSSFPGSEENNENYSSQEQTNSNISNQMKKAEKHFMAPTVSTASKVTPKKKVLVERNENLNVESSNDCDTNLGGGYRSKPCDNLTNYLSPRPKFLRFDPNRRSEILNRIEKEIKEELRVELRKLGGDEQEGSSVDDVNVYVSREMENALNDEIVDSDSECDEDEEEEDEFEEGRSGWCLNGVLKVLFALVGCLWYASYISSMSSSMDLPSQQAVWEFKDGYAMVQNGTLESVDKRMFEAGFLVVKENVGYFEADEVQVEGYGNVENEKVEEEVVRDVEVELEGQKEDLAAIDENVANEIDEAVEIADAESGSEFELEKVLELEDVNNCESKDDGAYMIENEEEASHYGSIGNDGDIIEAADKLDEVLADDEFKSEADSSVEMVGVENEMQDKEAEDFTPLEEVDSVKLSSDQEEVINQFTQLDDMELFEEPIGLQEKSDMEEQDYGLESAKTGRSMLLIIGLSILSIVLASLAFLYRSAKVKIMAVEVSKPVEEKLTAEAPLTMERKITLVEEPLQKEEPMERKFEFPTPTSTTPSIKEVTGSNNNSINVPTVELLGEIVVGPTRNNSFRSGVWKDDMVQFEESNTTRYQYKSNTTRYQDQSPLPKPLSDPQESFTAEMKNLQKQGAKKAKATIEVTPTPVRRSGRLRNRAAAMSP